MDGDIGLMDKCIIDTRKLLSTHFLGIEMTAETVTRVACCLYTQRQENLRFELINGK